MKCETIRDLLPLRLDGLASEESRREVEKHLAGCPACREAAQGMKARIETPLPPLCPDTIRPFRKLRRRMVLAVLATILACTLAAGCAFFCGVGWQVDSGSVRMESSVQNGILTLDFMLRDGGILRGQPLGKFGHHLEHRILRAPLLPVRRSGKQSETLFLETAYRGSGWKSHSPAAKRGAALSG